MPLIMLYYFSVISYCIGIVQSYFIVCIKLVEIECKFICFNYHIPSAPYQSIFVERSMEKLQIKELLKEELSESLFVDLKILQYTWHH